MEHKRVGLGAQKSYFFVYYYLLAGIILLIAAFLFVEPVSAQTVGSSRVESSDVVLDESITAEDLGVTESVILQDSFLYRFKRFGRGFQEFITFDPVKKAEIQLKHANQELADAQQLLEQKPDDVDAIEAVVDAVERFENNVGKLTERIEGLQEKKQEGDVNVDLFLDNVLDKQIKQQKVLEKLEQQIFTTAPVDLASNVLEKIQSARNNSAEVIGEILIKVENNENNFVDQGEEIPVPITDQAFSDLKEEGVDVEKLPVLDKQPIPLESDTQEVELNHDEFENYVSGSEPLVGDLLESIRGKFKQHIENVREEGTELDEHPPEFEKEVFERQKKIFEKKKKKGFVPTKGIEKDNVTPKNSAPLSYRLLKTVAKIFLT